MRRRLLALDMDGTILLEDCTVPAGHARAIAAIRAMGVQVALVTGRPLLTTRWLWRQLGLETPAVCFNGGWVGLPDQRPLAQSVLAEHDVRDLLDDLADDGGAACCYPDADSWVMDRELPLTQRWRDLYQAPIRIDADLRRTWRGPSCKLMYVAEPARIGAVVRRLQARFHHRFHVVLSQPDRFEISPLGVTKAWGLERLAAHLGVARAQVWAAGDADNDLEMLAWAGHGCAMGHAPARVRAAARHLLPGITARGLCALPSLLARSIAADD